MHIQHIMLSATELFSFVYLYTNNPFWTPLLSVCIFCVHSNFNLPATLSFRAGSFFKMQMGKATFRSITKRANITSRDGRLRSTLLLKRSVPFYPVRSIFHTWRSSLQFSVKAADLISLFIIHCSYILYFKSSKHSYMLTKDRLP